MAHTNWSEESLRLAEESLADDCIGTWRDKIAAALDAAIDQRRAEEYKLMNERLLQKINELEGHS